MLRRLRDKAGGSSADLPEPAERQRLMEGVQQRFPQEHALKDGRSVTVRLMNMRDEVAFLRFTRALPPDDLLYEQEDITSSVAMDELFRHIRRAEAAILLAFEADAIVGYASLRHSEIQWTRHLGEIRMVVAPDARGTGLGRLLAGTVSDVAKEIGLQELSARMVGEQGAAQATFVALGFEAVATLPRSAIDTQGEKHDLVVMMLSL